MASHRPSALIACLLWPAVLYAGPVLHEYLPLDGEPQNNWAKSGSLPASLDVADGLSLPAPDERAALKPQHSASSSSVRLDGTTTHDGVLNYRAEFNPSIVPLKRVEVFDVVGTDYALRVGGRPLRPQALSHAPPAPSEERFWGSIDLSLSASRAVRLPSVAAGARIISYRTEPPQTVAFFTDAADAWWVRGSRTAVVRLLFVTVAPHSYFSVEVPPLVRTEDVPERLRPQLPSSVQEAAQQVLHHIGVRADDTIRRQLERLVAYFRNFKAEKLSGNRGDLYLSIALSQRGVCRHRAQAFVITAQALGIPARYVQNEAHAFVEVYLPRRGWLRIDLGGASSELRVARTESRVLHRAGPDPFPRPARFAANYSQLGRQARGVAGMRRVGSNGGAQRVVARGSEAQAVGASSRAPGAATRGTSDPGASLAVGAPSAGDATEEGSADEAAAALLKPTQIELSCSQRAVSRGDRVRLWGRVSSSGRGIGGLRLDFSLSRGERSFVASLGAAVSVADGVFEVTLEVPSSVPVGRYVVVASTPGDNRYAASVSR
ncbi:MAG: transglutaminase domain-containing protein [Deltaproteobacteria bacterium]|nr:transglutaminase domain-containing protein [Deltaproteobacteria bacterium]